MPTSSSGANTARAPLSQNQPPSCEKMDKVVYNAAQRVPGRAPHREGDPRPHDPPEPGSSRWTEPAREEGDARDRQELPGHRGLRRRRRDWYEKYAKEDKTAEGRRPGLQDATLLRLGLGEEDEAIARRDALQQELRRAKPEQTASIAFALGAHYADKEDWDCAKGALDGIMGLVNKAAPTSRSKRTPRSPTRVHAPQGGGRGAGKGGVCEGRDPSGKPTGRDARMNSAYPDEDGGAKEKRVAKALTAVGEAYLLRRRRAEARPTSIRSSFPEYHGPGTKDGRAQARQYEGGRLDEEEDGRRSRRWKPSTRRSSICSPSRRRAGSSRPARASG